MSLPDLKDMMAECGVSIDHLHLWVVHFSPLLLTHFNRRKRAVTGKWHADETYIKSVASGCISIAPLHSVGDRRVRHGRPDPIVNDGSDAGRGTGADRPIKFG